MDRAQLIIELGYSTLYLLSEMDEFDEMRTMTSAGHGGHDMDGVNGQRPLPRVPPLLLGLTYYNGGIPRRRQWNGGGMGATATIASRHTR